LTPIFSIHSGTRFERLGLSQLADNGIRPDHQAVWSLAWNANKSLVATGHQNGVLRVWDVTQTPVTAALELSANDAASTDYDVGAVRAVIFRACDRQVVAISANGTLRGWETETGEVFIDDQFDDGIIAAEFSPDGTLLAYSADGVDDIVIESVPASPAATAAPCDMP
jgi:WD40 repeat protein